MNDPTHEGESSVVGLKAVWSATYAHAGEMAGHARPHPVQKLLAPRVWRQILRDCRLSARYVAAFRYFPEDISTETEPAL